ncbi:TetR/AcrR family transcriptional regulator, partial [Pseudomonas syringae pv. tagetis]
QAAATRTYLIVALDVFPQKHTLRDSLTLIFEMIVTEHRIAPALHKSIHEELPSTVRHMAKGEEHLQRQFSQVLRPFMK